MFLMSAVLSMNYSIFADEKAPPPEKKEIEEEVDLLSKKLVRN